MRQDWEKRPLAREFVLLKRRWSYWPSGNEFAYYYDDHPDLDGAVEILRNYRLIAKIPSGRLPKRYRIGEELADYLLDRARVLADQIQPLQDDDPTQPAASHLDVSVARSDEVPGHVALEKDQQRLFRQEGAFWTVAFEGKTVRLKNGKGMKYMSYLLAEPHREFAAVELLAVVSGNSTVTARSSAGVALDEQARAQYEGRAREIEAELAEARANNDLGRIPKLLEELEQLANQMTAATGLGGRRRLVGDTNEKARKSVSTAVSRARRAIAKHHKSLGQYLQKHLSLGTTLSYRGDGAPWNS